jgi:aldose sugar dehydrogenase
MLRLVLGAVYVAALPFALAQDVPTLTQSTVLGGLEEPWDLAFLPSGEILYTEKCKGLSILKDDNTTVFLFGKSGALDAPDVFCEGQSGVLGVTVDPEFSTSRYVYTFVASKLGAPDDPDATTPATNHIVRLTLSEEMNNVTDRLDIIKEIPFKNAATPSGDPGAHSGGRLRFSPFDGFLYMCAPSVF